MQCVGKGRWGVSEGDSISRAMGHGPWAMVKREGFDPTATGSHRRSVSRGMVRAVSVFARSPFSVRLTCRGAGET